MTSTAISEDRTQSGKALLYAAIVIVVAVFATTLPQTGVLAKIPLQNFLKNELHADRSANAAFFFWAGFAWYFKPIAGILTDAFPVFGSRRKSYLLVSGILATLAWIGLSFTPHEYNPLLWIAIVINLFMVVASAAMGGYMVEIAQLSSGSGRLTALRQFVTQICTIIAGPGSGYLATLALSWTALACGGIMFLLVPVTMLFLMEQRKKVASRVLIDNAVKQFGKIGSAKTMWAAAGLMALFYIAPGISTAIFYKQQDDLHMDTQAIGFLALISGVTGIIASIGYAYVCRRFNLRTLLVWSLFLGTAANVGYLFYSSVLNAQIIEGFNGFGYTLAELALMDLAICATPRGSEALGFSLMMSVRNLALFGTDWLGSAAMDTYHVGFNTLVLANTATTLITVPLVFLLPRVLLRKKDAELYKEAPAPRTALQE